MYSADEYVWCYSEKMNWWTGEGIPPGLPEAITSARQKIAEGRPLGFDITSAIQAAQTRAQAK